MGAALMRRAQPWLGTFVEIDVDGLDPRSAQRAIDAAFDQVRSIHLAMSYHAQDSDLSRLNRAAPRMDVEVNADTWAVLRAAGELHAESAGLFDCAVADTLVLAGLLPMAGEAAAIGGTQADVELVEPGIVRKRASVRLDLGGIAKGYAVDAAVEVLRRFGVESGSVNAGGDLRVFGPAPRRIHVRDPREPSCPIPLVDLLDAALATSGGYFVGRDAGDGKSALVDPFRQRCVPVDASISVLAPTCMLADALTKIVALSGNAQHPLLATFGAQALWLANDENRRASSYTSSMLSRNPRCETSPQSTIAHIEPATEKVLRLALSSV